MAKKGTNISRLIDRPSVPKKVVGLSIFALALVLGIGLVVSIYAASGSVKLTAGHHVSKSLPKKFCAKATVSGSGQHGGQMTINGSQIYLNGTIGPICTKQAGSFRFDDIQGNYTVTWSY